MVGSLQESRIPVDCLHNVLHHFGTFEVCRVTTEVGSCYLVSVMVENLLAKPALLKTPRALSCRLSATEPRQSYSVKVEKR